MVRILDWFCDRFLLWRPMCLRCWHRRKEFVDGLCFDCNMDRMTIDVFTRIVNEIARDSEKWRFTK